MALKIFTFMLLLFSGIITYLSLDESIFTQPKSLDENFPVIDFANVESFQITKEGIDAKIYADRVLKFTNKDEMYNVKAHLKKDNITQNISANKATLKDKTLYLKDKVRYENNNSLVLLSENLEYNMSSHIAISNSAFTLTSKQGVSKGEGFRYDSKNALFEASSVEFIIKEVE